jgi:hypothetical protein
MTKLEIRTLVRSLLNDEVIGTAKGFYSDTFLDSLIIIGKNKLANLARSLDSSLNETLVTFTTTANSNFYAFAGDFETLISISVLVNNVPQIVYKRHNNIPINTIFRGFPEYFDLINNTIYFTPTPDGVYTVQLEYTEKGVDALDPNVVYSDFHPMIAYHACRLAAPTGDTDPRPFMAMYDDMAQDMMSVFSNRNPDDFRAIEGVF